LDGRIDRRQEDEMLSDALSDAADEIRQYLKNNDVYHYLDDPVMKARIYAVLRAMAELQLYYDLDSPGRSEEQLEWEIQQWRETGELPSGRWTVEDGFLPMSESDHHPGERRV
jgi:hypothetical protein